MGTSVGVVTDYLVTLAGTVTASITTGAGDPIVIFDGYPTAGARASVVIGLDAPPDTATGGTDGTRQWVQLGALRAQEDYTVPFYIDVSQGGTDMSAVRLTACAVFDAFYAGLHADLTLGGLVSPYPVEVDTIRHTPTLTGQQASQGRRLIIQSAVRVRNRYIT
jgi:hypothetical protein